MKKINKYFALLMVCSALLSASSCTDDFQDMNTNPKTTGVLEPQHLFYSALTQYQRVGQAYNGIWYTKSEWLQYTTPHQWFTAQSNMNVRWTQHNLACVNEVYTSYNNIGGYVTSMEYTAEKSATPERYSDLVQMGRILLIAKAIQTSDTWGSLIYSDGWLAREGMVDDESMLPRFQTQEELVPIWDSELKECIQKLKAQLNATNKASMRGIDRAYNGDPQKWIKAANGIRLRLASRLWKINRSEAIRIATDVLSQPADDLFGHIDDSFILWFDNLYTTIYPGDWHSYRDLNRAAAVFMDYLNEYDDPRKPIFFIENNLTQANIEEFNKQQRTGNPANNYTPQNPFRMIPPSYGRWMGAVISFDAREALPTVPVEPPATATPSTVTPIVPPLPNPVNYPNDAAYNAAMDAYYANWDFNVWNNPEVKYDRRYSQISFPSTVTNRNVVMLPANAPQTRLWRGLDDFTDGTTSTPGSGGNWAPIMTYAEFCLLAAEFVLEGNVTSSKTAQVWYETGVRASLDQWDALGTWCRIVNQTAMTQAEKDNFLSKPGIAWNTGGVSPLEQIYAQSWVEHYKNQDEAWALWKRTDFPGKTWTKLVTYEPVMVSGTERFIPRRARIPRPTEGTHNYANLMKRIDDMAKDPKFGAFDNEFGRVWWDAQ